MIFLVKIMHLKPKLTEKRQKRDRYCYDTVLDNYITSAHAYIAQADSVPLVPMLNDSRSSSVVSLIPCSSVVSGG